jgi:hypothetical protein
MDKIEIKSKFNYWDFLRRHILWVLIGIIAYSNGSFSQEELHIFYIILIIVSLFLGLSGIAAYCFTSINFLKEHQVILGFIVLAIAIIIHGVLTGTYLAQYH